ncbi:hypothetical protein ACI77O_12610 [Pseudomonas tritici]|uniref:hypothetical protein n=1 Tax=Pseudomonas tritici TaxID=2745518 RepID=UPI00387B78A3
MNLALVASVAVLSSIFISAAHADDEPKSSPEATAAGFIASFYSAKAEDVKVTILKRDHLYATALTELAGHPACSLDMAKAPQYVRARYGWLVGGLTCDKSVNSPSEG